MMNMVVRSNVS